ncbi:MAG: outer membrane beta-barrel protein [Pseudomonadota bacterium]
MKNILIALIAAAAIAPVAAQAESYIGANVGRGELKFNVDGIVTLKNNDTAFKVYGGYNFNKFFGIEAGYADLGKLTATFEGDTASASSRATYVAATGAIPLAERFALIAKVGVANSRTKITAAGEADDNYKNTGAMFGVGTAYLFTPSLVGVVEYENFGKVLDEDGVNQKSATLSVGLRFKF